MFLYHQSTGVLMKDGVEYVLCFGDMVRGGSSKKDEH